MDRKINRRWLIVDLNGNWKPFLSAIPEGMKPVGTVERNGETGALVENGQGGYLMISGTTRTLLLTHKVLGAISSYNYNRSNNENF